MPRWIDYNDAQRESLWAQSTNRMGVVASLKPKLRGNEWWRLLGSEWESCDDIWAHSDWLRGQLVAATDAQLAEMMTNDERTALSAMPEEVKVFRGCYEFNRFGLSWTTKREIAERFPYLNRYKQDGQPLLVTGTVSRARCVLKLERDEWEIVHPAVLVQSVQPIDGPAVMPAT